MNQQLQQQHQHQLLQQRIGKFCVGLVFLLMVQQQVSCQAARDDVLSPLFSYALSPFNNLAPNTFKGLGSDVSSAQENLMAALSPSFESVSGMMKNMQDATSSRYQAMDKIFIRFLAELAQPENLCRQLLAESKNALKLADAEAANLLAQATSGASQASQGASSFMNKFSSLG